MTTTPSMRLIKSVYNEQPTFRLIPITADCPYNEVIFEPINQVLAIVSKEKKPTFKMIARLTDNGDAEISKIQRGAGKPAYKEQRVTIDSFYEYHLTDRIDITMFITKFAENEASFEYMKFFKD